MRMFCYCTKEVGVHSSLIENTKNGYLFAPGNSSELEKLLESSINGELPLLGKQAREEILKNWSALKEAENLIKVYQN